MICVTHLISRRSSTAVDQRQPLLCSHSLLLIPLRIHSPSPSPLKPHQHILREAEAEELPYILRKLDVDVQTYLLGEEYYGDIFLGRGEQCLHGVVVPVLVIVIVLKIVIVIAIDGDGKNTMQQELERVG